MPDLWESLCKNMNTTAKEKKKSAEKQGKEYKEVQPA